MDFTKKGFAIILANGLVSRLTTELGMCSKEMDMKMGGVAI